MNHFVLQWMVPPQFASARIAREGCLLVSKRTGLLLRTFHYRDYHRTSVKHAHSYIRAPDDVMAVWLNMK